MARNARFWVWSLNGGWVKLTLKPGEELSHHTGGSHDEGYTYHVETYSFDGELVECQSSETGCDCDGRLDRDSVHVCPLELLHDRDMYSLEECSQQVNHCEIPYPENRGILAPRWVRRAAWQRDYAAEAAGY